MAVFKVSVRVMFKVSKVKVTRKVQNFIECLSVIVSVLLISV